MKIFIQGPAGSGKNVIGAHLADKFKINHINYRSIVLSLSKDKKNKKYSFIGKTKDSAKPFDPNIAFSIINDYLNKNNIKDFVLDGYPKSREEATLLRGFKFEKNEKVLTFFLDTPEDVVYTRLKNRLVCPNCSYVLYDSNPNSILDVECINCHEKLTKRADDNDKDIKLRLVRFKKEKEGILKEMSKISQIKIIAGAQNLSYVINDIVKEIEPINNDKMAEDGARVMIEGLGLNLADPNIVGTARRIARSLKNLMVGQYKEAQETIKENLSKAFPTKYKGMVILEPIKCVSLCSHHLLPVSYEVLFGYIPKSTSLGFSKINKVINLIAAKPTLQEDFTQEVTDIFYKVLKPKGIMVVVRGKHTCMTMRGERFDNTNITSALRGVFKESQKARDEFLSLSRFN